MITVSNLEVRVGARQLLAPASFRVGPGDKVGLVGRNGAGKTIGTFFADEVAGPLGLHAWIGLPEEQEENVARIEYAAPFTLEEMTEGILETTGLDADTVNAWMTSVWGEGSVQAQAGTL